VSSGKGLAVFRNPLLPQYFMWIPPLLTSCNFVLHLGQLSGSEGSLGSVKAGLRDAATLPLSILFSIGVEYTSPWILNREVATWLLLAVLIGICR
jgi:hypothetical protein